MSVPAVLTLTDYLRFMLICKQAEARAQTETKRIIEGRQ